MVVSWSCERVRCVHAFEGVSLMTRSGREDMGGPEGGCLIALRPSVDKIQKNR